MVEMDMSKSRSAVVTAEPFRVVSQHTENTSDMCTTGPEGTLQPICHVDGLSGRSNGSGYLSDKMQSAGQRLQNWELPECHCRCDHAFNGPAALSSSRRLHHPRQIDWDFMKAGAIARWEGGKPRTFLFVLCEIKEEFLFCFRRIFFPLEFFFYLAQDE